MTLSWMRTVVVWLTTTAACATVVGWASADLAPVLRHTTSSATAEQVLLALAAAALSICAGWCWAVTTAVIVVALGAPRASEARAVPGVPDRVRRAVLGACGLAVAGVLVGTPAHAAPGSGPVVGAEAGRGIGVSAVAGLPLPDRPVGVLRHRAPTPTRVAPPTGTVVVRAGDSLWSICVRLLPPSATAAEVADLVARLYATNRAVIGDDPDLILPGHDLRTPPRVRPTR